jgi:DNA-binding SARP family transcriptional activator/TolB-like protein
VRAPPEGADTKIQLRLLGAFSAARGEEDLTMALSQPKRLALVTWLALTRPPGLHRRDTLCALLWPESPDDKARAALRQLLLVLRRDLGPCLLSEGDLVGLAPGALGSDAGALLDALESGQDATAVDLFTGDLLPGFHLGESETFERWFEGQRSALRRGVIAASWRLAQQSESADDPAAATRWAERAVALDPEHEDGLRRLLTLHALNGDRAAALRNYERFARRLQVDWGTEPEAETRELVTRIRDGGLSVPSVAGARTSAASPPPVAPAAEASRPDSPRIRRRALPWLGAAVVAATTLVAGLRQVAVDRTLIATRVLVTPFANHTGDPKLDAVGMVAADWVIQALQRSGNIEVVDPATAILSTREAPDRSPESMAGVRGLAGILNAGLVVVGAFAHSRDSIIYTARLVDARNARVLSVVGPLAASIADPMSALDELRSRLAGAIAAESDEPLRPLSPGDRPPRLEAYQAFATGLERFAKLRYDEAVPHFNRAIASDSSFSLAMVWLSYALTEIDKLDASEQVINILRRRADREVPAIQAWLEADSLERIDVPQEVRVAARRRAARLSPGSYNEWLLIFALRDGGRPYEEIRVLKGFDPVRSWFPRWADYWLFLGQALHQVGDFDGQLDAVESAQPYLPFPETRIRWRLDALAALGRTGAVRAGLDTLLTTPGVPAAEVNGAVPSVAYELEAHGDLPGAIDILKWAGPLQRRRLQRDTTTLAWVDLLFSEATLASYTNDRQLAAKVRRSVERVRLLTPSRVVTEAKWAYLFAACAEGDSLRISTLPDSSSGPVESPIEAALILLCQGDREGAIRTLGTAPPPDWAHLVPTFRPLRTDPRFQQWLRPRG